MKHLLLLLFLLPGQALEIRRPMWQVPTPKTWDEAQNYCGSEFGGDLLTALSQGELEQMDLSSYYAWVGIVWVDNSHYHWRDSSFKPHPEKGWTPSNISPCVLTFYQNSSTVGASCSDKHFFYYTKPSLEVFFPEAKSWSDAQNHCSSLNLFLGEFLNHEGPQWPGSPFYVAREFPIWIGLQRNGGVWGWSDNKQSDFRNWAPDLGIAPNSVPGPDPGSDKCVAVSSQSKSMSVQSCSKAFPFLCYKHNMVLVQERLNWEQALETCKTLMPSSGSFRLLRLQQSEIQNIKNVLRFSSTSKVWVGLRFLGGSWFWSDGGAVSLSSLPECPKSGLHCGALVFNRTSGSDPPIELSDCSLTLNVLCYGEP